jgi:hypothetical protein
MQAYIIIYTCKHILYVYIYIYIYTIYNLKRTPNLCFVPSQPHEEEVQVVTEERGPGQKPHVATGGLIGHWQQHQPDRQEDQEGHGEHHLRLPPLENVVTVGIRTMGKAQKNA